RSPTTTGGRGAPPAARRPAVSTLGCSAAWAGEAPEGRVCFRPVAGRGDAFRWTVALLSVGFILGAYVDAASRLVNPSPLAPWNDVFMDAAWLAATGFMAVVFGRALSRGVAWRDALPAGYHLALAGGLVFGLGALADVYYQIAFGFGTGLEALL